MRSFTDPLLTDSATPGAGETNVNRAVHVQELRGEVVKASLFVPHLDERPVKQWAVEHVDAGDVEFNATGSGCVRSIFVATDCTIDIWVDGEASPRVSCKTSELAFANGSTSGGVFGPYMQDFAGVPKYGAYINLPIPFHTALRIRFRLASGWHFINVLYNHSTTVDHNYGRYNYFNFLKASFAPPLAPPRTLLSVSGKKGALFGLYYDLQGTTMEVLEGDTLFTADGVANLQSGTEDLFFAAWYFGGLFTAGNAAIDPVAWPRFMGRSAGINKYQQNPNYRFGMYRYFDHAPINFDSSLSLTWGSDPEFDTATPFLGLDASFIYYTET